ncbi:MAG TPA: lipase family protein [Actinoallomurus sp.]|jgi:pimeloyl-ACP methyl ester carboxylesterase
MRSVTAGLALVGLFAAGCAAPVGGPDAGEAVPRPRPAGTFYRPPMPLPPGPPGGLIRSEPVTAPAGVRGWRILYHSRGVSGADVAVSGTVFVPATATPPGGRHVVAWAHGTTGSGDSCAPSTDPHPLNGIEDGAPLVAAGDAIVATDYEGLGTPGPHPYLVGTSEAHSVLDAVRAAAELPGTGIGRSFVVFGHSQGGQAALFTGELAAGYAPELRLLGVAAASPPTDLPALARRAGALGYGIGYLIELAAGYSATDPSARLRSIMTRSGAVYLHLVEDGCNDDLVTAYTGSTVHDTFTRDPRTTLPWSTGLARGSTGPLPARLPILIMQGARDPIVPADLTAAAVRRMCQGGDTVDYRLYPGAAHNVVPSATDLLNTWITARFHHDAAPRTCGVPPARH